MLPWLFSFIRFFFWRIYSISVKLPFQMISTKIKQSNIRAFDALVLFEIERTRGYLSISIILKNDLFFLFFLKTINFWFIHFLVAEELPIHYLKFHRRRWNLLLNLLILLDISELLGVHDVCYGKLVGWWLLLVVLRLRSCFWLIVIVYLGILSLKFCQFFLLWVISLSLDIELRKYTILAILGCQLLSPSLPPPVLPFFFFLFTNSLTSL